MKKITTLDKRLSANDAKAVLDAELLEIIPVEFRDEYEDRLRFASEYETKFAERQARLEPESDLERERR